MKRQFLFAVILIFAGMFALKLIHTQKYDDWRLILVNDEHSIPYGYTPELMELSNGIRIDERIYPDLQRMFDDARNVGIYPVVSEGYRTHDEQKKMMSDKVESFISEGHSKHEAKKLAHEWVAEAGRRIWRKSRRCWRAAAITRACVCWTRNP